MGLFDIEKNIVKIPFKSAFIPVVFSITSRLSSTKLFFVKDEKELSLLYCSERRFDEQIFIIFRELPDISLKFKTELSKNSFQIDINDNIPIQMGSLLETITDIPFEVDENCYHFLTMDIDPLFQTAREQYEIRRRCNMKWFQHPENIGYVHFIFNKNIHWYYPIEYILKS
jgi:hypothetical protein